VASTAECGDDHDDEALARWWYGEMVIFISTIF
jgi:hypothetical protein